MKYYFSGVIIALILILLLKKKDKPKIEMLKPDDIKKLSEKLVKMLREVQLKSGLILKITSGLRTPEQNKKAGGVKNSAHLFGLAVDIFAPDKQTKEKLIRAAYKVGFRRIGVGGNFIHLDIDTSKAEAVWGYGGKEPEMTPASLGLT